jgi:hypothetical protein
MYAPPEEKHPEQRIFSMALYVISALGAIAQYAESIFMNITGCVILLAVGFMLKAQKLTAEGTIYVSHVRWISRTMSIASYFLFPVSFIVILYLTFQWTDMHTIRASLQSAENHDMDAINAAVQNYIAHNQGTIDKIFICSITPPILWWVRRCWYGYQRAKRSEPIDFPDSIF